MFRSDMNRMCQQAAEPVLTNWYYKKAYKVKNTPDVLGFLHSLRDNPITDTGKNFVQPSTDFQNAVFPST